VTASSVICHGGEPPTPTRSAVGFGWRLVSPGPHVCSPHMLRVLAWGLHPKGRPKTPHNWVPRSCQRCVCTGLSAVTGLGGPLRANFPRGGEVAGYRTQAAPQKSRSGHGESTQDPENGHNRLKTAQEGRRRDASGRLWRLGRAVRPPLRRRAGRRRPGGRPPPPPRRPRGRR
jgi:hypothetical protein